MRSISIFASALILLVATSNVVAGDSDTVLVRIYSDSSNYLQADYIPMDVYIVNNTDRSLSVVPPKRYGTVKLRCYNSAGELVKPYATLHANYAYSSQTYSLPARDSLKTGFDLKGMGGTIGKNNLIWQHPIGDFTVQAIYVNKLFSDPLRYSVVKPTGVENEIYDRLVGISNRFDYGNLVNAVGELEDLLARYPNSVYAPQFLYLMLSAYLPPSHPDDAKVIAYGKRLVADYPNCWECFGVLNDVSSRLSSLESIAYLQEVIATKANTRAELFARVLLGKRGSAPSGKSDHEGGKMK